MAKAKIKPLCFIGCAHAYGDSWLGVMRDAVKGKGIEITAVEKYGRTDTSVTGQVLQLISAKPDAVLIAGAGPPSALPQKEQPARNYQGTISQHPGAANNDALTTSEGRRAGKAWGRKWQ